MVPEGGGSGAHGKQRRISTAFVSHGPPAPQEFIRLARHGSAAEVKKAEKRERLMKLRDEQHGGTPDVGGGAEQGLWSDLGASVGGANVNARDNNEGTACCGPQVRTGIRRFSRC